MPRQFIKIWTDALDDDFFTGLSWTEIGIITKLCLWCKVTTDSGEICSKNVTTLSAMMGVIAELCQNSCKNVRSLISSLM